MSVSQRISNERFQKNLAFGQIAETSIAQWIIRSGRLVLPIYDIEYEDGKGPRLFGKDGQYVAPDLLVVSKQGPSWIEAKHKTVFSWYAIKQQWETGIDKRHYNEYLHVAEMIDWPIWLLFLHRCSTPDRNDLNRRGCPEECPVGLFGNTIAFLKDNVSHTSDRHGRSGMVYWAHDNLKKLATLEQLS